MMAGKVVAAKPDTGAVSAPCCALLPLVLRPPVAAVRGVVLPFIGKVPFHLPEQPPHLLADKDDAFAVVLAALLLAA
jgi:hypothetical protein